MKWKQSTQIYSLDSGQSGGTLMELMVATFMSVLVVGLTLPLMMMERNLYVKDTGRTALATSGAGAMDYMGLAVRQAGEKMGEKVPALELIDGTGNSPDELKIRSGILETHFVVCRDVAASDTEVTIFRSALAHKGCADLSAFDEWDDYLTAQGSNVTAFIYDTDEDKQEFFEMQSLLNPAAAEREIESAGALANSYNRSESYVYVLDQTHFFVEDNYLKVRLNDDDTTIEKVIHGVTDMQVTFTLNDGTELNSFDYSNTATTPWTDIHFVNIELTVEYNDNGESLTKVISKSFFPRNGISGVDMDLLF